MNFQLILFYLLAAIILFGALKTVTVKNPVHAALYLVLTFCMSAMMWMLMQAEFLGITLVVVYVGAVMVLFLFVVMMLNIDVEEMRKGFWRNAPVAAVVGVLMAVALIMILVAPATDLAAFGQMNDVPADHSNVRELGTQIYTTYLLPWCWVWWPPSRWYTAKPSSRNTSIRPTRLKWTLTKAACVW